MLDVMSQAANAIEAYDTRLRAISSNITNLQVTGYKRTDVSFESIYNKLISMGTGGTTSDESGGINPTQFGGTVGIANTSVDFKQGDISGGGNLDVAINGEGLFIVSPDDGQTLLYSRAGEFQVVNNKLLTKSGLQVYGMRGSGGVLEPIDLTGQNYTASTLTFDNTGNLVSNYEATTNTYGNILPFKIALTKFNNPSGLMYMDNSTFAETAASGSASSPYVPPAGEIQARSKEASNIVYTSEIVDSMEIQRALNSTLTVVRLVNDVISQFIQKLG